MAILAGLPAKNDSTGFWQESQGHDKDLDQYRKVITVKNLVSEISDPQSLDCQVALMAIRKNTFALELLRTTQNVVSTQEHSRRSWDKGIFPDVALFDRLVRIHCPFFMCPSLLTSL